MSDVGIYVFYHVRDAHVSARLHAFLRVEQSKYCDVFVLPGIHL